MPYATPSGRVLTTGDFLDTPVRELMNPGVISISENASLDQVYAALAIRRVHAVLVVGSQHGTPLGWATATGLLGFAERDTSIVSARDAITEQPHSIVYGSSARDAIAAISEADTSHLLVVDGEGNFPVGVISDIDLAAFLAHS